jgi:hypothetical protein
MNMGGSWVASTMKAQTKKTILAINMECLFPASAAAAQAGNRHFKRLNMGRSWLDLAMKVQTRQAGFSYKYGVLKPCFGDKSASRACALQKVEYGALLACFGDEGANEEGWF